MNAVTIDALIAEAVFANHPLTRAILREARSTM